MNFKTPNEKTEFDTLLTKNPKLVGVVNALDFFTQVSFGKSITVTEVYRTKEEHDKLYAATPEALRPKVSPHMSWESVDIRSSDFTDAQIQRMLSFLNCFVNSNGKSVAIYHRIAGNAFHFHIQKYL